MKTTSVMNFLLVIFASFLLALKGIFAKLSYAEGASIDATLFYRFLLSIPFVLGFLYYRKKRLQFGNLRQLCFLGVLSFFGYYLGSKADYTAIHLIGAGISRLLLFTFPVFVIILNALINRQFPDKKQVITIVCCQIGLFLTLGGLNLQLVRLNLYGALFSIISAVSYAFYIILIGKKAAKIDSQYLITWVILYAFLFIAIDFFFSNDLRQLQLTKNAFFWILLMSIFSTALPLTLFAEAIKRIGANHSAIVSTIGPVFTLVASFIILQESYSYIQLVGAAIILVSICFHTLRAKNG
jgi:drug/metabolite transporter (DMT)-like permease